MLQSTPQAALTTVLNERREVLNLTEGLGTVFPRPRAEKGPERRAELGK